jgi:hypothetical protein
MEQYDQHMKQILPKPSLMPVRVDLKLQITQNDGNIVSTIDLNNIFQDPLVNNMIHLQCAWFYHYKQSL